jgi:stage V sporulation protein G
MEVTEIKVFPVEEEKLKAFVSIVFDHCFMVNDIKVIKGRDGLFISMPSRRKKNGKFKDVAHPLNNETRQMIEGMVLKEYEIALNDRGERHEQPIQPIQPIHEPKPEPAQAAFEAIPEPATPPSPPEETRGEQNKSLEEVTEMHLRDSFWSS